MRYYLEDPVEAKYIQASGKEITFTIKSISPYFIYCESASFITGYWSLDTVFKGTLMINGKCFKYADNVPNSYVYHSILEELMSTDYESYLTESLPIV